MAENEEEEEKEKKRIKELEEKVKKPEEEVKAGKEEKEEPEEGGTGIAEEIIGGLFPGLGKMVKGLKKSEVFKERFEEVDREIEERMKEGGGGGGGGREISRGRYSIGKRPGPHIEAEYSVRTLVGEKHEPSFRGREEVQRRKREEEEPLIDIMDEKDYIMVIAEMPGVEEKDIKAEIGIGEGGDKLIISTEGEGKRGYYKEVDLPSKVKGEIKRMYKHGVLEVRLEKEAKRN
jgi:HSP20 family protein